MKFPRTWRNKTAPDKQFSVMPWWDCVEPIISDEDTGKDVMNGRRYRIGAIVQVGWLFETNDGIWVGMGLGVEELFEDVTPPEQEARRLREAD